MHSSAFRNGSPTLFGRFAPDEVEDDGCEGRSGQSPMLVMTPAFAIRAWHSKVVILDLASDRRERRVSGIHSGTVENGSRSVAPKSPTAVCGQQPTSLPSRPTPKLDFPAMLVNLMNLRPPSRR